MIARYYYRRLDVSQIVGRSGRRRRNITEKEKTENKMLQLSATVV